MTPKPRKYSMGNIYPTPYGTWRARVRIKGRLYEKNCKSLALAEGFIDAIAINCGRTNRALSPSEYYAALCAIEALPAGVTLLDAARDYSLRHGSVPANGRVVQDAISDFLQDKRAAALRPKTLRELRYMLNRLDPGLRIDAFRADMISTLVQGMKGTTRNNHLRAFHNFFEWCRRRNLCALNPTDGVTRARLDPAPPGIITVEQTRGLLTTAQRLDPALIHYLAIAFFAGLRTAELHRLDASAITDVHIHVGAHAAKTREQRYVTVLPSLTEWLRGTPVTVPIIVTNHYKRLRTVYDATQVHPPHNAARHTFASHHLAAFQDAPRTAHELGHRNPDMLYQHYRNLVTHQDGLAYFKILP